MIVTTVTYLNMTAIKAVGRDMRLSLERERKRLVAARNWNKPLPSDESPKQPPKNWDERLSNRIKKVWNLDVEATVRRIQNTDWERMVKAARAQMTQATDRVAKSVGRLHEEDSKKKSA